MKHESAVYSSGAPPRSSELAEAELSGQALYGDNLSQMEIQAWYEQEETGYFDLRTRSNGVADPADRYAYEYGALNYTHAISELLKSRFRCCVALGCASGDDVAPIAPVVDRFVAIEPAEKWWRTDIGGKPASYLKPAVNGTIHIESNTADLATSFGVLHHIPNVSYVTGEIARVLRSGGLFVVREPISWMGDWRRPRAGLTSNERGLPPKWFENMAEKCGFQIIRRRYCLFPPLISVARALGFSMPYASNTLTYLDWILSEAMRWNSRYRRDTFVKKLAPGSAFWILRKI